MSLDTKLLDFVGAGDVTYLGEDDSGFWRCDLLSGPVGEGSTPRAAILDAMKKKQVKKS